MDSWLLCCYDQPQNQTQILLQVMATNITLYNIKRSSNVKKHQLQVIHIYEANYNFPVEVVWREAIQHTQQLGKINQGQYGECPGRDYMSVTYLEELRRDIPILTQAS